MENWKKSLMLRSFWFDSFLSANTKTNEFSVVVACQFSCSHSQRLLKSERLEGRSKWIREDAVEDVQLDLTSAVPFESSPKLFERNGLDVPKFNSPPRR